MAKTAIIVLSALLCACATTEQGTQDRSRSEVRQVALPVSPLPVQPLDGDISTDLRSTLAAATQDICMSDLDKSVEERAVAAGWLETLNPISKQYGDRSYLPSQKAWKISDDSNVYVFEQRFMRGGVVNQVDCVISFYGPEASIVSDVILYLMLDKHDGYEFRQDGDVYAGSVDHVYSSIARTYLLDDASAPIPRAMIYTGQNRVFGLTSNTAITNRG